MCRIGLRILDNKSAFKERTRRREADAGYVALSTGQVSPARRNGRQEQTAAARVPRNLKESDVDQGHQAHRIRHLITG